MVATSGCTRQGVLADESLQQWLPSSGVAASTSYATPHANGARNSRVAVAYSKLSELNLLASVTPVKDKAGRPLPPASVLLPENAALVLVDYGPGHRFELRRRSDGSPLRRSTNASFVTPPRGRVSGVNDKGALVGSSFVSFEHGNGPLARIASGRPLATALSGKFMLAADLTAPTIGNLEAGQSGAPWAVHASLREYSEGIWKELWYFTSAGADRFSCAAIDRQGHIALASKDGSFAVVGPQGTADGRASSKVTRKLSYSPYTMSSTEAGWILVEPRRNGPSTAALSGLETYDELLRRAREQHENRSLTFMLYNNPRSSSLRWKSGVIALDANGNESWATTLPFRVLAPPIELGGGRIAVVGDGLAAIERGQVVWRKTMAAASFATAFADDTLAVATGRRIVILNRNGQELQELLLPEGQSATTPPALSKSGELWIASKLGLYVARPLAR